MRKKLPYKEGDVVCVPLRTEGYAIGIISRKPKYGHIIYGYFFGPKIENVPTEITKEISELKSEDAILIGKFTDDRILNKKWHVVGSLENWNRDEWPLLPFIQEDPLTNQIYLIILSEVDLIKVEKTVHIISETEKDHYKNNPKYGLMGHGFDEIKLTKFFDKSYVYKYNKC